MTLAALPPDKAERGAPAGDPGRGAAVLRGQFDLAGGLVDLANDPWAADGLDEAARASLHRFGWLDDLAALDSTEARQTAATLFDRWDERCGSYTEISWRADVLAARIVNWLANYAALYDSAETSFRVRFLDSIARQLRHLRRVVVTETPPEDRLDALKGLIYGEACVTSDAERVGRALALLEAELERDILPDGSHVSRSPGRQLDVLEKLIDIRAVLTSASQEVPVSLRNAIDRMAPMTRFLRHCDGALACFHGGGRPDPARISRVLIRSDAQGRAPKRAPYAGYERVDTSGLVLILDGAAPPVEGQDAAAHAGVMSFELSANGHRLFVNCGAAPASDEDWHQALRTTAAHSTMVVDDRNSCELTPTGVGRRPASVECDRGEIDGNIWISSSHDGYEPRYGLTHRRRLYIDRNGGDLRGEDILVGNQHVAYALRFHLHPAVTARPEPDARALTLALPNGDRWRFRSEIPLDLEDSVYCEDTTGIRRSRQIVVRGETDSEATGLKWRLHRDPADPPPAGDAAEAAESLEVPPFKQ